MIIGVYIFTQLLLTSRMWHKVIYKRSLTDLNSEFSFSYTGYHTKVEEFSLLNNLTIAGGRKIGFRPYQIVFSLYEMQTTMSKDLNLVFYVHFFLRYL